MTTDSSTITLVALLDIVVAGRGEVTQHGPS